MNQKAGPKKYVKILESLAKLEVGVTPKGIQMIAQAKDATNKTWKAKIKTVAAAAMLMQGTRDDLEHLEQIQQAVLVSVGLKVGAPAVQVDWACPQC